MCDPVYVTWKRGAIGTEDEEWPPGAGVERASTREVLGGDGTVTCWFWGWLQESIHGIKVIELPVKEIEF